LLAASEAQAQSHEQASLAKAAHQAKNAAIVQTFGKRAREAALAAGATQEATESTTTMAAADAQTAFEENAMQE